MKFWLRQSDVMLRIVMLLPMVAVKLSLPLRRKAKLHLRSELHCQRQLHLPVRANLVEKSTCFRKCFFLSYPNNFEPSIYIQLFSFSYVNAGRIRNGVRYIHFNKFFYIKSDFIEFINILIFIFCSRWKKRNKYLHHTAIISFSYLT